MPMGSELYWDDSLGWLERWYCRLIGVPIVGLRIRVNRVSTLLPDTAESVLDAGCGRGVITRLLARRYPGAKVQGLDENASGQATNAKLAVAMGLVNCSFTVGDLTRLDAVDAWDLVVSVDNLEHIADDQDVLRRLHRALRLNGTLVAHVPHYYRRWPLLRWTTNFNVPGHMRPGYHLPELTERVRRAGFTVERSGFSYGFLENLANNASYAISGARERNKGLYAILFPFLNALGWLGQWSRPSMGAGAWVVARKEALAMHGPHTPRATDDEIEEEPGAS